jgi:integrase
MGVKVSSEGPVRITKATIEAAWRRRQTGARIVIRDDATRGLALVVNPSGMSWTYSYKPRGTDPTTGKRFPTKSVTIGGPATHSPDDARTEANRIKERAKGGADPAAEKRAKQLADAKRRATTIVRLLDTYAAELPTRAKIRGTGQPSAPYVAAELAQLRAALTAMKATDRHPTDIAVADVRRLVKAEAARPASARHRFGALSRFMDWCLDEGHVAVNVCGTLGKDKRPKPPAARRRVLTPAQMAGLWAAADKMEEHTHRDYARLLLAVPCRRIEAARMEWQHVDLDAAIWAQPGKMTKNGDPHRTHLPALALDLLRARHEAAGKPAAGLVFPAPRTKRQLTTFSAMKRELDQLASFQDWSWHDTRRSFATTLGEAGFSEAVADAMLNHRQAATRGGVLGGYQYAERWQERVAAMELWARILGAAIKGEAPSDRVADLGAARAARAG